MLRPVFAHEGAIVLLESQIPRRTTSPWLVSVGVDENVVVWEISVRQKLGQTVVGLSRLLQVLGLCFVLLVACCAVRHFYATH